MSRWQRKVGVAEQDYLAGIRAPAKDWQQQALASAPAWAAGVQQAIQNRSWEGGISRTPTAVWQQKTIAKAPRWRQGVQAGSNDYARAMQTVLGNINTALQGLPPRGPAGSEANIARATQFMRSMHQATLASKGGGGGAVAAPLGGFEAPIASLGNPYPAVAPPMGDYGYPSQTLQYGVGPTPQRYIPPGY